MFLAPPLGGIAMRASTCRWPAGFAIAVLAGVAMGGINAFLSSAQGHSLHRHARHAICTRVRDMAHEFDAVRFPRRDARLWPVEPPRRSDAHRDLRRLRPRAHVILAHTTFGRQIYAFGNDRRPRASPAINTGWVLARVYLICSACAAAAGFVLIAQIGRLDVAFGEGASST